MTESLGDGPSIPGNGTTRTPSGVSSSASLRRQLTLKMTIGPSAASRRSSGADGGAAAVAKAGSALIWASRASSKILAAGHGRQGGPNRCYLLLHGDLDTFFAWPGQDRKHHVDEMVDAGRG